MKEVEQREGREGVNLVGVKDEPLKARTAQDRRQGGESIAGKVQVLQAFQTTEESVCHLQSQMNHHANF